MIELKTPQTADLDDLTLKKLIEAGNELDNCARALTKGGINVVGEVLRGQGTFYEMDHYPEGDVYDPDHHAQYYYHAHRGGCRRARPFPYVRAWFGTAGRYDARNRFPGNAALAPG